MHLVSKSKSVRFLFVVGLLMVFLVVSACGNGGNTTNNNAGNNSSGSNVSNNQNSNQPVSEEPVKITMMNLYDSTEPPKADSYALGLLEELTNTELDITWVPKSVYNDKLIANVSASNNLPQALLVRADRNSVIIQAVRAGMFWEIGPYLDEFPNLAKLDKIRFDNMAVDGKYYGLYRWRPIARDGLIIRKDWLDNLGLEIPKTMDELVDVLYAFTNDDPDQNGANDTFGLSNANGGAVFNIFLALNGAPNKWGFIDDQIIPSFMTQEYRDTLDLFRQMYKDRVFNTDFPLVEDRSILINQGKAGLYAGVYDDLPTKFIDLQKLDPNAELIAIPNVSGPSGKVTVNAGKGYNSVFMFPKTSVKTEEELKQILAFFDKTAEEEVQNLLNWGIEGTHFQLVDGKAEFIDHQAYADNIHSDMFPLMVFTDGQNAYQSTEVQDYEIYIQENEAFAVADPALSLISPTFMEKSTQLDQMVADAMTKYIVGDIDEAGYEQFIAEWKAGGGDQIIEEFTEQYKANLN